MLCRPDSRRPPHQADYYPRRPGETLYHYKTRQKYWEKNTKDNRYSPVSRPSHLQPDKETRSGINKQSYKHPYQDVVFNGQHPGV